MHTYKIEVFLNDENGNPTRGRVTTIYADNADKAESVYNQYHDEFQVDSEGKRTGCRVYTVYVHTLCYKKVEKPVEFFAQFHA